MKRCLQEESGDDTDEESGTNTLGLGDGSVDNRRRAGDGDVTAGGLDGRVDRASGVRSRRLAGGGDPDGRLS